MSAKVFTLTAEEKALVARIKFDSSLPTGEADAVATGHASSELMQSLIARKAIPEIRTRYFTDPAFNIGGRGLSRLERFERNGTTGEDIFRHPHFLKYLWYFLYGPDLKVNIVEAFRQKVNDCGSITSGDIIPLGNYAKQLTRSHHLDARAAAKEFYKLALECDLAESDARSIRDAVKNVR